MSVGAGGFGAFSDYKAQRQNRVKNKMRTKDTADFPLLTVITQYAWTIYKD